MAYEFDIGGLSMSYGSKPALRDISCRIPPKKVSALIGPSGCGKSSFLSCMNLLYRSHRNAKVEGSIQWRGENLLNRTKGLQALRKDIGTLFQQATPFPTSIKKNLWIPLKEHFTLGSSALEWEVEKVLRTVGLWQDVKDKLNHSALSLSGGQMQRLCLARALTLQPQVILMDEPCSALDPLSTETIEHLIQELKESITIVLVTHNLAQARRIADHVFLFWHEDATGGFLEASAPSQEFFLTPPSAISRKYIEGLAG